MLTIALILLSPSLVIAIFIKRRNAIGVLEIYLILQGYFFLGPLLAQYLGFPVYSGIAFEHVDIALSMYFFSVLGIIAGLFLSMAKWKLIEIKPARVSTKEVYLLVALPAQLLLTVGILKGLSVGAFWSSTDKVSLIAQIGSLHYPTMTLVPCFILVYMAFSHPSWKSVRVVLITTGLYFLYSFMAHERDFILFVLPIYFWAGNRSSIKVSHAALLSVPVALIFIAGVSTRNTLFAGSVLSALLNQGSNLMVATQTVSFIEKGGEHIWGLSYLSAILDALTLGIIDVWGPGSKWLSEYFSNGVGAYGFSLEAEAYLNFGLAGVFFFFFFIARYYRVLESFSKNGGMLARLCQLHFAFFCIYAIRGEFLMIIKSLEYCLIIFFIASAFMGRGILFKRI